MAVTQESISIDCPKAWRDALTGIKHAWGHTWENCQAMQLTTGFKTSLYCFRDKAIRIVCPIMERRVDQFRDLATPYGFSGFVGNGDCESFSDHWLRFVKDCGYVCGYIGLNPLFENDTYYKLEDIQAYNRIYVLDLALSAADLFKNLSENRKRQLKNWDRLLAAMVLDRTTLKAFLLANYRDFFSRKNASPAYSFSSQTMSILMDSENVFAVGMGDARHVEAVSVFTYTPHVGEYLFNLSIPGKQRHSVALLWYGMLKLKSLGVPLMNLGGGIIENDGVAQFKQRLGGKTLTLRCLKQVYNPAVFSELCQRMNVDPHDRRGYFPPWAQKLPRLHTNQDEE
jgi:hypothetical protein